MTWAELRDELTATLIVAGVDNAAMEARWIVERVGGDVDGAVSDEQATATATARAHEMAARRGAGEPLQYVLGEWSFRGIDVYVDSRVLIPRPETEITAQIAIAEAEALGLRRGRSDPWAGASTDGPNVADLGTGSGVIALALAHEIADVTVWAIDASGDALAVARANFSGAGTVSQRVRALEGDWFDALPDELRGRLSLVVSNPPYVAEHEELPAVVAEHEPRDALVAGPTGLEDLERILYAAPVWLTRPGTLVLEHAPHQVDALVSFARSVGFDEVAVHEDLAGRPRVLVCTMRA